MKASKKKGELLKKRTKPTQVKVTIPEVSKIQHKAWESFTDRLELAKPAAIERGQVWSTLIKPKYLKGIKPMPGSESRLVLVLDAEGETLVHRGKHYRKILVAPISPDIEMASRRDFIVDIDADASPLGYPFMVEVWNKITILVDSLNRFLGTVDNGLCNLIGRLNSDYIQSSFENSDIDWDLYGKNIGDREVKQGNEIYHFQRREVEATEYLNTPLKELANAPIYVESRERQAVVVKLLKTQIQSSQVTFVHELHTATFGEVE